MSEPSDLEESQELLPRRSTKHRSTRWVANVAFVGLSCIVVALSLGPLHRIFRRGQNTAKTSNFLRLQTDEQEPLSCFEQGMFYDKPRLLPATQRTIELNADLCQERCQGVDGCAHFTFWPDGGCLLSGAESILEPAPIKYSATVTGPKYCQDAIEKAKAVIEESKVEQSGLHEDSSNTWGASKFQFVDMDKSEIQKIAEDAKAAAKTEEAQASVPARAGVNGTTCAMYPACVAVGISLGECCPNEEHVTLGCCHGFPKTVEDVKIAPGAECSKFPACAASNMTGACCPTAEGMQLNCCSSI